MVFEPVFRHIADEYRRTSSFSIAAVCRACEEELIAQDSGKTTLARTSAFVPVVQVKAPAKAGPLNVGAVLPNGVKLDLSELDVGELSLILKELSQLPCSASPLG
jgi:hypothetical protein